MLLKQIWDKVFVWLDWEAEVGDAENDGRKHEEGQGRSEAAGGEWSKNYQGRGTGENTDVNGGQEGSRTTATGGEGV